SHDGGGAEERAGTPAATWRGLKKNLEASVKDLQLRMDEAENMALKGGKKQLQKLEARVVNWRVKWRSQKSTYQTEEDKKTILRPGPGGQAAAQSQGVQTAEQEAEEQANAHLARLRKVQHELEEAQERAESLSPRSTS
ncbi:hypothetical protein INR49_029234, partial [Caranx melampygus]